MDQMSYFLIIEFAEFFKASSEDFHSRLHWQRTRIIEADFIDVLNIEAWMPCRFHL